MSDPLEIYQAVILDHHKSPRNYGRVAAPTHTLEAYNPLCGDRLTITLDVDRDRGVIKEIKFEGSSCAIARASASLMTIALSGKAIEDARARYVDLEAMLSGTAEPEGDFAALSGVRSAPTRKKCATLGWRAVVEAFESRDKEKMT